MWSYFRPKNPAILILYEFCSFSCFSISKFNKLKLGMLLVLLGVQKAINYLGGVMSVMKRSFIFCSVVLAITFSCLCIESGQSKEIEKKSTAKKSKKSPEAGAPIRVLPKYVFSGPKDDKNA